MTQVKARRQRAMFTVEQKLDYVKLMVNEGCTNRKIIDISGAGSNRRCKLNRVL
jgi:hypothetical protein